MMPPAVLLSASMRRTRMRSCHIVLLQGNRLRQASPIRTDRTGAGLARRFAPSRTCNLILLPFSFQGWTDVGSSGRVAKYVFGAFSSWHTRLSDARPSGSLVPSAQRNEWEDRQVARLTAMTGAFWHSPPMRPDISSCGLLIQTLRPTC